MVTGRAAGLYTLVETEVTGSISGVSHKLKIVIVRIIIPACLIKQFLTVYTQPNVCSNVYQD